MKKRQFVIITLKLRLSHLLNLAKAILDHFDDRVELFNIYFENCARLADTLSAVGVRAYASDVLETE